MWRPDAEIAVDPIHVLPSYVVIIALFQSAVIRWLPMIKRTCDQRNRRAATKRSLTITGEFTKFARKCCTAVRRIFHLLNFEFTSLHCNSLVFYPNGKVCDLRVRTMAYLGHWRWSVENIGIRKHGLGQGLWEKGWSLPARGSGGSTPENFRKRLV